MKMHYHQRQATELLVAKQQSTSNTMRDDISLSSTLTADALPHKSLIHSQPPTSVEHTKTQEHAVVRRSRRKSAPKFLAVHQEIPTTPKKESSVKFNEDVTQFYDNEMQSAEDCEEMWYNREEYDDFKKDIIKCAKRILRFEAKCEGNTMGGALEHAYASCLQCESEAQATNMNEFLQPEVLGFMKNHYRCEDDLSALGLERLIVRRVSKDRQELRRCLFDIVFDLQKNKWPNKAVLAENVAMVGEEATRSSRVFARVIGAAQVPYLLTLRA